MSQRALRDHGKTKHKQGDGHPAIAAPVVAGRPVVPRAAAVNGCLEKFPHLPFGTMALFWNRTRLKVQGWLYVPLPRMGAAG
jgi:hypothetical protein